MKNYGIIITMLSLLFLGFCFGCFISNNQNRQIEITSDTLKIKDTIYIDRPEIVCISRLRTITDTLKTTDTIPQLVEVKIPITQTHYADSTYDLWISGFQSRCDSLRIYPTQTTITQHKTQYRAKKWGLGINAGYAYDINNNRLVPTIGVGLHYNILNW